MPTLSSEAFKSMYFTNSSIGAPLVQGPLLIVPIENVDPFGSGLPPNHGNTFRGKMIFRGVRKSVRTVFEYLSDPKVSGECKPQYDIVDVDAEFLNGVFHTFGFEGICNDPVAWTDWNVLAESVEFLGATSQANALE